MAISRQYVRINPDNDGIASDGGVGRVHNRAEREEKARSPVGLPERSGDRKRGRPRIEQKGETREALKPWLALKMSRSTWYRREAERRKREAGDDINR